MRCKGDGPRLEICPERKAADVLWAAASRKVVKGLLVEKAL